MAESANLVTEYTRTFGNLKIEIVSDEIGVTVEQSLVDTRMTTYRLIELSHPDDIDAAIRILTEFREEQRQLTEEIST